MSISPEDIIAQIRKAAAEQPDAQRECKYVLDGTPHCIVGVALHNLGVPLDFLNTLVDAAVVLRLLDVPSTPWVERVQFETDLGATWKEAIDLADAVLNS